MKKAKRAHITPAEMEQMNRRIAIRDAERRLEHDERTYTDEDMENIKTLLTAWGDYKSAFQRAFNGEDMGDEMEIRWEKCKEAMVNVPPAYLECFKLTGMTIYWE